MTYSEATLKAQVERLQGQVDELIKEQVDFMADHTAIIEALRDEMSRLRKRVHDLEHRGRDE